MEFTRIASRRQHVVRGQEYSFELTLKEVRLEEIQTFTISKDISQEVLQLELPEGWMIHNMFNKDLLTWCKEPQFKSQHMEPAPPPDIINEEEEYEVKEIRKHRK